MNKNFKNKKELLNIYESFIKGDMDFNTLDSETIHILSILISEDLKIHKKYIDKKINESILRIAELKKL
ncbi:MAG TPA: hypothetical protein DEP51_05150 [Clostridiales bacterium]|nr:hypothetical protein [Clostridiales bacterium]